MEAKPINALVVLSNATSVTFYCPNGRKEFADAILSFWKERNRLHNEDEKEACVMACYAREGDTRAWQFTFTDISLRSLDQRWCQGRGEFR